jgi:cytosine/creatinine deaminase
LTSSDPLLFRNVRLPDNRLVDLLIEGGRIARIGSGPAAAGGTVVEGAGRLVSPGFVEPHLHLDKAFLMERLPGRVASVAEAIAVTAALKRQFTRQDILERAEQTLRLALRHGTLAARVHAEVDPVLGLTSLEAALELRQRWRGTLELQVCAFPQDGIQRLPGTEDLLREALRLGADVIGGVPYVDPGHRAHVDTVLALADEFGKPADFHVDFSDDPAVLDVGYIAERTLALGLTGRVAVGHVTTLATLPPARLAPLLELLAQAELSVLTLPATDLHLGGRGDAYNTRRGLTPVRALLAAGVNLAAGSNNVRNAFTPFGNADPLEIGLLLMVGAHLSDREDLPTVWQALTANGARALGLAEYGLAEGRPANLVLFEAPDVWEALVGQAEKRYVVANGRVVAENRRESWLALPD